MPTVPVPFRMSATVIQTVPTFTTKKMESSAAAMLRSVALKIATTTETALSRVVNAIWDGGEIHVMSLYARMIAPTLETVSLQDVVTANLLRMVLIAVSSDAPVTAPTVEPATRLVTVNVMRDTTESIAHMPIVLETAAVTECACHHLVSATAAATSPVRIAPIAPVVTKESTVTSPRVHMIVEDMDFVSPRSHATATKDGRVSSAKATLVPTIARTVVIVWMVSVAVGRVGRDPCAQSLCVMAVSLL